MGHRGLLVALEGPSGVGKSTVARALAGSFGFALLPEAFDRLDPPPSLRVPSPAALASTERTLLAEEARRYRAARRLVGRGRAVVADTGFLGPLSYTAGLVALGAAPRASFDRLRAREDRRGGGSAGAPDVVVYLVLPRPTVRRRVARDPVGHPPGLAARHAAVAEFERAFYLGDVVRGGIVPVRRVSALGAPGTVARRVVRAVSGLGPLPRPRAAAHRARAALARALDRPAGSAPPTGARSATVKKEAPSRAGPLR